MLETAIKELTDALNKNNALLEAGNEGRDKILAAAGGKAATATTAGKASKETAAKEVSPDDLKAAFAKYLETDDEKVLAARKAFVKEIVTKLDAPSVLKIATAEDRVKAATWLAAKIKDKKFVLPSDEPAGDEAGEEDDMLG